MLLCVLLVQRLSCMCISNPLPPLTNSIAPVSGQQTFASSSHVYTQKQCCGPSIASHSLLWVLQSQRLMLTLVAEGHTPLEGTYLHMPRQWLRNICCLIDAWEADPIWELLGTWYAQWRVNLTSIVFRKNQTQDAGAIEASALEDGASVGTQDLDLKDPGGARLAVFLPGAVEGSVSGNYVWQGIPGWSHVLKRDWSSQRCSWRWNDEITQLSWG